MSSSFTELRGYHAVTIDVSNGEPHRERRYVPLREVRVQVNLAEQVVAEAQREFIRAKDKLALYEEHVRAHHPAIARVMDTVQEELAEEPA